MPQTIQATVDPHLLRELPRFFGGSVAIIREVIQNAVRAGASTLEITLDGDVLTFADNGCGLDNPELLLSVARSGWGEGVQHPAGMGVLSTLGEDFSRSVTFSSHDWRFPLTFEDFASQTPTTVQAQTAQTGFTVSVQLAVVANNLEELIRDARARAPLTVTYNGQTLAPTVLDGPEFDLGWGRVILDTGRDLRLRTQIHTSGVVFWEGFPIGLELRGQLSDVAQAAAPFCRIAVLPRPGSGITPKLPDRNAIAENAGLVAAVNDLSAAIEKRVLEDLRGVDLSGPVIRNLDSQERLARLSAWCAAPVRVLTAVLRRLGFVEATEYPVEFHLELAQDEEDDSAQCSRRMMVRRDAAVFAGPGQCAALALLRDAFPDLPVGSGAAGLNRELEVQITERSPVPGLRQPPSGETASVRLVTRIVVDGVAVPWFVEDGAIVLATDVDGARALFGQWREQIGAALLAQLWDSGEYRDAFGIWKSGTWSAGDAAQTLHHSLIQHYFPDIVRQREAREEVTTRKNDVERLMHFRRKLREYGTRLDSDGGLAGILAELEGELRALD